MRLNYTEVGNVLAASVILDSLIPAYEINDLFSQSLAQSIQNNIMSDLVQQGVYEDIMGGTVGGEGFGALFDWLLEDSLLGGSRLEVLVNVIVNTFFPSAQIVIEVVEAIMDIFNIWVDGLGRLFLRFR